VVTGAAAAEAGFMKAALRFFNLSKGEVPAAAVARGVAPPINQPWYAIRGAMPKNDAEWWDGVQNVVRRMTPSTHEVTWRRTTEPLYRLDNRPPGRLLEGYFVPENYASADFFQSLGGSGAFVSTTRNAELAWPRRFQYELRDLPGGIDADATAGVRMYGDQREISFPGGYPARYVSRWRAVLNPEAIGQGGYQLPKFSDWVPNRLFNPM
jgi:hypothetical protein